MGKLYELIKDSIIELKKYRELELKDFSKAKTFSEAFKVERHRHKVNAMLDSITEVLRKEFGYDKYYQIIDRYKGAREDVVITNVSYSYEYKLKPILDYETLFNHIEETVPQETINNIISSFNETKEYIKPVRKPLEPYVKNIISDMENIKGISDDEKMISTKYLNYLKDEVIKKNPPTVEKLIDMVSHKRSSIADQNLEQWAQKNGMDGHMVGVYDGRHEHVTVVENSTNIENELFKPTLDKKVKFSSEFKEKIIALNRFLETKSVLKDAQAGESGFKEYGFLTYFNTTSRINKLIDKHLSLESDSLKRENLFNISAEAIKLQKINKEYDEILDYIKENFNVDDVALCTNIYSGRPSPEAKALGNLKSDLPERWDNENAPYGVILNGYVQLMALVKNADTTLEDILNDPLNTFIDGAKKNLDKVTEEASMKINEAPLGKRIANMLVATNILEEKSRKYIESFRGIEFLENQCEENDEIYDNISTLNIGFTYANKFGVSVNDLFGYKSDIDMDSLKNLFAFGNEMDNLYMLSKNYPVSLDKKGVVANAYDQQIKSKRTLNPVSEYRKILETCKDFFNEHNRLVLSSNKIEAKVNPGAILLAGKEYFKDFLLKNSINPLDIPNEKERKEVLDFLNNPLDSLQDKYGRNNEFYNNGRVGFHKFNDLEYSYKECEYAIYERNLKFFSDTMSENSKNTLNANKTILKMLDDNKGGYFERKFSTTSKEYFALTNSLKSSLDAVSGGYGDFTMPKYYAQKYLAHKLPDENNFNKLKENEKRRVEFCKAVIKTCDELELRNKKLDIDASFKEKERIKQREEGMFKIREANYNKVMQRHKIEKEYSYSKDVKLEENENYVKVEINKVDFKKQVEIDSSEPALNNDFEISNENEVQDVKLEN